MENKLIIKTTVTESREVEKEISLPFYSKKSDETFFKVYADGKAIKVYTSTDSSVISEFNFMSDFSEAIKHEPCTEQEFNNAFTKALEFLSKNVDLWVTVQPLPTPEEFGLDPNGNEQQRDINLITC